jgi:hypothetical protein
MTNSVLRPFGGAMAPPGICGLGVVGGHLGRLVGPQVVLRPHSVYMPRLLCINKSIRRHLFLAQNLITPTVPVKIFRLFNVKTM